MSSSLHVTVAIALGGTWLGCQGDPLDKEDDIAGWANAASALGVFAIGHQPLGYADGQDVFSDPDCPAATDDGTTMVLTGDCQDGDGTSWAGSVQVRRDSSGGRSLTFDGFGDDALGGMVRTTGTFSVAEVAADVHTFDVDVTREGGIDSDVIYQGKVEGGYTGPTVWNGSGTISRRGITINSGTVDSETVDEARDTDVCAGQGVSGTTTMMSDDHVVVITYDGATDCDGESSARWSRDGEDRGLVTGVSCSTGGGGGPQALALALVALTPVGLRRRKARTGGRRI